MKNKISLVLILVLCFGLSISVSAFNKQKMITVSAGTTSFDNGNITLDYNIEIGKYEVTFKEYIAYCNDTGEVIPYNRGWDKNKRPVINVSWYDAVKYCNWLSKQEGLSPAYDTSGSKKIGN